MFSRTRTFFILTARGLALLICHALVFSSSIFVLFYLSMWITVISYVSSSYPPAFFLIRKPEHSHIPFFSSLRHRTSKLFGTRKRSKDESIWYMYTTHCWGAGRYEFRLVWSPSGTMAMVESHLTFDLDPCVLIKRDGVSMLHNQNRAPSLLSSKRKQVSMNQNHSATQPPCDGWGQ